MNLFEITAPYLQLGDEVSRNILVTPRPQDESSYKGLPKVEVLTMKAFLNLDENNPYSSIMISGVFGEIDIALSQQVLQKAISLLRHSGILSFDVNPIEKINTAKLKDVLGSPESISNNAFISRGALKTVLSENFEFLTFRDSRSISVPDVFSFRYVNPAQYFSGEDSQEKKKRWGFLRKLRDRGPPDELSSISLALSGKHIPNSPQILLIGSPKGLISELESTLTPKKIMVLGVSGVSKSKLPDGSFDFIYLGDGTRKLSSSEYLKLIENISRLRSKRGCVLIKDVRYEKTISVQSSQLDKETWVLNYIVWAKSRHSSVKSETLSMGSNNYICVSVDSPYGMAIKHDISNGEASKALLNFKKYTERGFFTSSEASRIVRSFQSLDLFYEALYVFAIRFSVLDAVKFGLLDLKHSDTPILDIVSALQNMKSPEHIDETVIFDLIGEFYRLSNTHEMAVNYWTKSLSKIEDVNKQDKRVDILTRKIKLFYPYQIDCVSDSPLASARPKTSIILAESNVSQNTLEFLNREFDGTTIFSPNPKEELESLTGVTLKPLMGIIPEDSSLNRSSHEYAEKISNQIILALIKSSSENIQSWFETHKDSLALTIEDFLARHLLMLESYAEAANSNPNKDVILTGGELGYFDTSRRLLLSRLSHKKVWLHSHQSKSDLSLYQDLWNDKKLPRNEPISEDMKLKINDWFNNLSQIYVANMKDYFSAHRPELENASWVAGNLANRYFGESVVEVARALNDAGETPVIIDSSTTRSTSTDYTSLWESCSQSEAYMDIPTLGMLRPKVNEKGHIEGLGVLKNWVQAVIEPLPITYHGAPASFAFSRLVAKILSRDIPILLYSSLFAEELISRGGHNRLITLSTREPHDHIFADIMQKNGIPVTLVQCVETLRHPRYKKPVADHITAIDQAAFETFTDFFGVPEQSVTITDSPLSQINFRPERIKALTELFDERGLALNPPLRILFATRTGSMDENIEALNCAAEYIKTLAGAQLIVKTHPREESIRLAAYAKTLKAHNLGGMPNILSEGVAETLILLSEYVISFPSNVVRVALDRGKPTLVYRPTGDAHSGLLERHKTHYFESHDLEGLSNNMRTLLSLAQTDRGFNKNQNESLKRICDTIKERKLSEPMRTKTVRVYDKKVSPYSSLSFKEVITLIKHQARQEDASFADIRLFKKALELAKSEKDFTVILYNLAHYAAPSLMAAEFFVDLSKSASASNLFCEAIGELQSQKLAGYAIQLEQSNINLNVYTILALAQSCVAIGEIEAAIHWYDAGIAQRGANPLRARLEDERASLSLLKWQGGEEIYEELDSKVDRLLVVAERGTDLNVVKSILPDDIEIEIYFDGKAGETLGAPNKLKSKSSRDVLDDRVPEIKGIVQRANLLAKCITTQALKALKTSQHIAWLKDIRPAMEMELRGGLITQLRRHAALSKAIFGPYDAIVFACHTPTFLALFSDSLEGIKIPTFVVGASQSPQRRHAFGVARRQGLTTTRKRQEALLQSLKAKNTAKDLSEFDDILGAITPRVSERHEAQMVIAVTSWRITTIKDGCLSLLENFPPDVPITIFDTSRRLTDAKRFLSDITGFAGQTHQDIRPFSAQYHNIPKAGLKTLRGSHLAKSIFAGVKLSKNGKNLSHAHQLGIWNQIGTLLYKTLPMLYDLHIQIFEICKQSGASTLMIMPGRDAESLTAQNAVQPFDIITTDVQTAYFSTGYTYTAPNGDVVTAMDEWSEEVFVNRFKIPEHKIYNVGTSRFDRFSKLRISYETIAQAPKIRPHICLATQPIQSEFTREMLNCLNDLYLSGIDFDCTVKLHPRQSEAIISEIESIASNLKEAERLTVTKHGDLAQILLASDMLVTAFSNVAFEAALMDRPVLIANFTGEDIPIPYVEFGIAEEVRNNEDFESLAKAMLYDESFILKMKKRRQGYFKRHPSQWKGEAGKNIAALIMSQMPKTIK